MFNQTFFLIFHSQYKHTVNFSPYLLPTLLLSISRITNPCLSAGLFFSFLDHEEVKFRLGLLTLPVLYLKLSFICTLPPLVFISMILWLNTMVISKILDSIQSSSIFPSLNNTAWHRLSYLNTATFLSTTVFFVFLFKIKSEVSNLVWNPQLFKLQVKLNNYLPSIFSGNLTSIFKD